MSGGEPSSIKHIQRAQQVTRLFIFFTDKIMQKFALYRKYRPLTFSDVHGQDHITNPLRRQIASGAIGHAYLFTGTRGTGKTTCSKIFSRAINCLNPKDGEPCNECSVCKGILDGSIFDVSEIDAASNTGVENIRDIRDDIAYAPITAKYKVYIIDEVHMLSTGAFNALLKTLEEPPEHVVFILATTEPHKVPATILSRCQRFDFFRLTVKKITGVLESVLEKEGKTLDKASISLVADLADGSMRDGLSILDRVLELESPEEIEKSLGVIGRSKLYDAVRYIASSDTDALYALVGEMYASSADMAVFTDELAEVFRRILAARSTANPETVIDASEEDLEKIKNLSSLFSEQFLIYALKTLRQTRQALSRGSDPRSEVEICLLLLARPNLSENSDALTARIEALEKRLAAIYANPASVATARPAPQMPTNPTPAPASAPAPTPVMQKAEEPKAAVEQKAERPTVNEEPKAEIKKEEPKQAVDFEEPKQEAPQADSSDEPWRELATLDEIASKIRDLPTQMLLKLYAKAVYRNNDVVIITAKQTDVDTLKKNIEAIRAAFEADHKYGRKITVERGDDTVKYVGSTYAYDNIETNPMFRME